MKSKNIFTHIDFKYFIVLLMLLVLALPLFFNEKKPEQYVQGETFARPEEPSLPIYPKKDMHAPKRKLNSYAIQENNISTPQVIQKIKNSITKENKKPAISRDFLFMDEEENNATSYNEPEYLQESEDFEPSSNNTITTRNNLPITPAKDGYYHKGHFYKDGTYPKNANKKDIDTALKQYRNTVAKQEKTNNQIVNPQKRKAETIQNNNAEQLSKPQEKPANYGALPAHWAESIKNFLKAENAEQDHKGYEGVNISGNYNRDNWPNGYYDNYNPNTFNMASAYKTVTDSVKNGASNNFFNIERPSTVNSAEKSANNSFTANSKNTQGNNPAQNKPQEDNHNTLILAIGTDPKDYYDGLIRNENPSFEESYANYGLQSLIGCNSGTIFSGEEFRRLKLHELNADNTYKLRPGTCPTNHFDAHVANVAKFVSKKDSYASLRRQVKEMSAATDNNTIRIVSTNKNVYPMVKQLNKSGITNRKGEPVTIEAVGPKEDANNLANVLKDVTNALVTDEAEKNIFHEYLMEFYYISQLKPINTMLAFQDESNPNNVIVLNDPNNSYWLKNPAEIEQYKNTTITQNGVNYNGIAVSKKDIADIIEEKRTNLIYIPSNNSKMVINNSNVNQNTILPNGSAVVIGLDEDFYSISSLDPQDIFNNVSLVGSITERADKELKNKEQK